MTDTTEKEMLALKLSFAPEELTLKGQMLTGYNIGASCWIFLDKLDQARTSGVLPEKVSLAVEDLRAWISTSHKLFTVLMTLPIETLRKANSDGLKRENLLAFVEEMA